MSSYSLATFGGGCFWCMEPPFATLEGVVSVTSGYMGGGVLNPSYEQVCSGTTGHAEVVQVAFDPERVSYTRLLDAFWRSIDPFDAGGQFHDRGSQYRPVIFVHTPEQQKEAMTSRDAVARHFSRDVGVSIEAASPFYPAEDYHQQYHLKNSAAYQRYHQACGRADLVKTLWKNA